MDTNKCAQSVATDQMAEGVGFEPTGPCGPPVFKTGAIDHSTTPPVLCRERDMHGLGAGFKQNPAIWGKDFLGFGLRGGFGGDLGAAWGGFGQKKVWYE